MTRKEGEATIISIEVVTVRRGTVHLKAEKAIRITLHGAGHIVGKDRESFAQLVSDSDIQLRHVDDAARLPLEDITERRIWPHSRSARQRRIDIAQDERVPRAIGKEHTKEREF